MRLKFVPDYHQCGIVEAVASELLFCDFKQQFLRDNILELQLVDEIWDQVSSDVGEDLHGPLLVQRNFHFDLLLHHSDRKIVQNDPRYEHLNSIVDTGCLEKTECHVEEVVVLCWCTLIVLLSEILKRAIIHDTLRHDQIFRKLLRVFAQQFFSVL